MKCFARNVGIGLDRSRASGFTMVEIALCLAIIGFALVAIIGVLPTGMGVQKDNREETIINQDATVWMDAIRNGALGYDDLTKYVVGITNYWTDYEVTLSETNVIGGGNTNSYDGYNVYGSRITSISAPPYVPLTNGYRIVGLLSTPKYYPRPPLPGEAGFLFRSNYVVAHVRSMSGAAVEKSPQTNEVVLDSAFTYRMIVDTVPYVALDEWSVGDTNLFHALRTNAHDLRLTFRWPVLPTGIGNGRQSFRLLTSGVLSRSEDPFLNHPSFRLYFHQPSTYSSARSQ